MATRNVSEKLTIPPIVIPLPDEWGSPLDYFPRCIAWAKMNLIVDGPKVVGAYYDGARMRTFSAYRASNSGCHISIELPENERIEYNESEAKLLDTYDRQLKHFICLRNQAGEEEFMVEWEMVKQRQNSIYMYMGVTTEAMWSQCRRMAYPFGKQFGRSWLSDVGGSKTQSALRRVSGGTHGKPPRMLQELLLFLHDERNRYVETALFGDGEPGTRASELLAPKGLKKLKHTTLLDYGEFIRRCREILDVIGEPAIA